MCGSMKRRNTLIDLEQLVFLMSYYFLNLIYYHYIQSEHWVGVHGSGRKVCNCSNHMPFFVLNSMHSAKY